LIENGLREISFTVFASDPMLRQRYMHDPTPQSSLEVIKRLAQAIDVYAAIVVLPGINDGAVLHETIRWLEDIGVRGVILMRFANTSMQGLILQNAPIIPGQRVHSVEEFTDLVTGIKQITRMRISGTPRAILISDPRSSLPMNQIISSTFQQSHARQESSPAASLHPTSHRSSQNGAGKTW
jgi:NifB/MoaA-like Fe-S oxidoreductase